MKRYLPKADAGPGQRNVEIGVALLITVFAVIVIIGSLRAGINWGAEGPRAGFFPFYIGCFILLSSMVNLFSAVMDTPKGKLFAEWGQLWRVMSVILPTALFVALIPSLGIYFCAAMLITLFMKWLGKYQWHIVAAVALGVPIITFMVFEKWFLVPLPKGPIEELLGF
jgi:putative tricarboxylic transport membrane protein